VNDALQRHSSSTLVQSRSVQLGRRLNTTTLPAGLEHVRSGAKKLAWTAFEARLVCTPARYAFRELLRPGTADYALRKGGGRFAVRHRSGDIDILRKFYGYGYYDWPPVVKAKLESLRRPVNVLDLGANIGFFQVHAREQLPIGRVVGFEPDPGNAAMLDRVRRENGADWTIIRACASNRDHTVRFKSGHQNFSKIAEDGDVDVPALDVFPYIGQADLVKMNIEGSEWEIMQDPRFAAMSPVWIVEYHRIRNPESNITGSAETLFQHAGYQTRIAMEHGGNGLLWAWKA
jgi:FkbM family methyltransferase